MPDTSWCRKGGSRGYVTTREVTWNLMWKNSPHIHRIPPGREFESSVPRLLRCLWSLDDPFYLKAALVHDTLLEAGARPFEADSQWRAAALSVGAPAFRTGIAFAAMILRRFGQWATGTGAP